MVTLVQITDTYISANPESHPHVTHERFGKMVDDLNQEYPDAAFIVHTGDLGGFHGELGGYLIYRELASLLIPPVRYVLGNHDSRVNFRESMTSDPGSELPWHWAFDHSGWSFIGIDSSSDASLPPSELQWLEESLKDHGGHPTLLFVHHNPLPIGNGLDAELMLREPLRLLDIVGQHPGVRCVAFGHMPRARTLFFNGTYYFCTPSPASEIRLESSGEVITDSDPCYRVFRLHEDLSVETWIRRLGAEPADDPHEIVPAG